MTCSITQLISYPIKSCAGIQHHSTTVNNMGLSGDRQLMLVDDQGLFLSQRKHPKMALIKPAITASGITVDAPGMEPLLIAFEQHITAQQQVIIWRDTVAADTFDQHINQWFTDYLNTTACLVKYGHHSHRPIDPDYVSANETVAFADGYPILVTHEATLAQLNQQLSESIGMDRFRPNIVLSSELGAWDELCWQQLYKEPMKLDLIKACTRCVMTGIEQSSGVSTGTEVLKTLKQKFAHNSKAVFGINAIAQNHQPIELAVGDNLSMIRNN